MKNLLGLLFLLVSITTTASYGEISEEAMLEVDHAKSLQAITKASNLRAATNGRELASVSEEDEARHDEFERLIAEDDMRDYLELSLNLL